MPPSPRHAEKVPRPGHGTPDREFLGSGSAFQMSLCSLGLAAVLRCISSVLG